MRAVVLFLGFIASAACASDDLLTPPPVQLSASASPRWVVDINRATDGVFRTYRPRCMADVRLGHTVEFRNYQPDVPANVTSIAGPDTMYSPNLQRPYNFVSSRDPRNTLCETVDPSGVCIERPEWSFWRFTFDTSGVYDWIDTNSSQPGRQIIDPYYGTVTFVGIDPSSPFGTICVPAPDGSGCESVCCTTDVECSGTTQCFRTDVDAIGRCLTPSG